MPMAEISSSAWITAQVASSDSGSMRNRGSLNQAAEPLLSYRDLKDVLEELKVQSLQVRREVAFVLGEVAGEDLVQPLAEMAVDPEPSVRLVAVDALGKIGGAKAVQSLMAIAKDDPDEDIRALAVEALGGLAIQTQRAVRTRGARRAKSPAATATRSQGSIRPSLIHSPYECLTTTSAYRLSDCHWKGIYCHLLPVWGGDNGVVVGAQGLAPWTRHAVNVYYESICSRRSCAINAAAAFCQL